MLCCHGGDSIKTMSDIIGIDGKVVELDEETREKARNKGYVVARHVEQLLRARDFDRYEAAVEEYIESTKPQRLINEED